MARPLAKGAEVRAAACARLCVRGRGMGLTAPALHASSSPAPTPALAPGPARAPTPAPASAPAPAHVPAAVSPPLAVPAGAGGLEPSSSRA